MSMRKPSTQSCWDEPLRGTPRVGNLMMVDDNKLDHYLCQRVIDRSSLVDEKIYFTQAEDALAYLRRPDKIEIQVILLDINMPRMNGFDFLEQVSREFGVEGIGAVVIMLTTSLNPKDKALVKLFDRLVKASIEKPLTEHHLEYISSIVGE